MDEKQFVAPGPGSWEIENTHLTRPLSRYMGEIFPIAMARGFKEATSRYGALLSHIEIALVNGFAYGCARAVGAPKDAKGPPPKFVFKLLCLLHPEIRRRNKRMKRAFENKLWREDVERWDREWRPEVDRTNEALTAIDPSSLDDAALDKHLEDCRKALDHAIYRHHSLNLCAMLPTGDFLAHTVAWTGLRPSDILALLRGSSPISVGATKELATAGTAIADDPEATKLLGSSAPAGEIVERLQKAPAPVGPAVRAYVALVGLRTLSGYDVADPCAFEVPHVLLTALRSAATLRDSTKDPHELAEATARVREKVPAEHRKEFDDLLEEARLTYRIRDERGCMNDARTIGITRRALLEAGKRLHAKGRIDAPEHVVHLTPSELVSVLAGGGGPSADELARHAEYRATHTTADAPTLLGTPPGDPPPAEWLPPYPARAMRAIGAMMGAMFEVPKNDTDNERQKEKVATVVRGLAASAGTVEGVARVVRGPSCFARVQKGDIVVAQTTSPTYNVLLPTIGGIVTDRGGLLSHAAIVAREYGLPAVVGTGDATSIISEGRRLRVDGSTGDVHLL